MPQACLLRVKRDIAEFTADPPPGIFIAPEETDITSINAIVMGASNTPHEGGFFHFYVQCTSEYPMKPPTVRFMTTDAGRVKFNEHIYLDGSICLSTINTNGSTWSPAHRCCPRVPVFTEKEAADSFESIIQHETIRVAVCDTVEACLHENSFAQTLKDAVFKKFSELYDKYEGVVKSRLHLTGTVMNDPMRINTGTYQFEKLLTRLRDLIEEVTKKNETSAANASQ
ncbi:hypothetical protein HPB49_008899 [Dermacentor silvarum]|uniref:Uncharacterized protein n=1 Tax=Dermacentor silvarum TaxID=543639 RepID=A0ACB8DI56_DERSI|nr:hypothetical protein HPB49_008899 [Dermacentor silvarum]